MTKAERKRKQEERKQLLAERKKARATTKRINSRISAIANKFGVDSRTYKNTIAPYLNDKTKEYTHVTKKGILQLNTSNKFIDTNAMKKLIKTANRTIPTITRIKERMKKRIESEQGQYPTTITDEQLIKLYEKSEVTEFALKSQVDFLYEYWDDAEKKKYFPELYKDNRGKRQLTYEEIDTFYERLQEIAKKEGRSKEFERDVFA